MLAVLPIRDFIRHLVETQNGGMIRGSSHIATNNSRAGTMPMEFIQRGADTVMMPPPVAKPVKINRAA